MKTGLMLIAFGLVNLTFAIACQVNGLYFIGIWLYMTTGSLVYLGVWQIRNR